MKNLRDYRATKIMKQIKVQYSDENIILIVPNFMAIKFSAYCAMREDILMIIDYLKLLRITDNITISSSLTYAIISLYGKCFTDASMAKYPKLEAKHLFKNRALL